MKDISARLKDIEKLSVSEISKTINHKNSLEESISHKSPEEMNALSPEMRTAFAEESIRRAVKIYGETHEGLTVDEIAKLTKLSSRTVQRHLDNLCKLREIYSITKGKRMTLYFPNGKPLWSVGSLRFEWPPSIFEVKLAKGPNNKLFLHILEKRYSILEGEKPEGGILLPLEGLNDFIKGLKKMTDEIEVKENDK